jgi:acetolactate synthase-1/2/3 large subunit
MTNPGADAIGASPQRTGARVLVDQLVAQGVNHLFSVPGESFLGVLDALVDTPSIRLVVNRHESASTFMAGAYARLTGQPGVAYVTRGPGACNAAVGLQHARLDSLPVVLFVGQVSTTVRGREAFQEIDIERLFAPLCKWSAEVCDTARLPEFIARAFQMATSGRPGPVVLSIPEDLLSRLVRAEDAPCHQVVGGSISDTQMAGLRRLLGQSQRPLLLVGGGGWTPAAQDNLRAFVEASQLPVVTAFRHQDCFYNAHANYIGDAGLCIQPRLAQRIAAADLILALGVRLDDALTGGYTRVVAGQPKPRLIHAHTGIEELGTVFSADLLLHTGMPQLAARLSMMAPIENPAWSADLREARSDYLRWQGTLPDPEQAVGPATGVDLRAAMLSLRQALPPSAIVCNGAGNYSTWLHRHFTYHGIGTQLAPASGTMGYAVPAAIAAKLLAPEKTVVCVSGDGDFLMSAQELATAVQYNVAVLFIVCNNRGYGTIRAHQQRQYPGRPSGTALQNPDFAALCTAYGGTGYLVSDTASFANTLTEALTRLREKRAPVVLELSCDPQHLSCMSGPAGGSV